MKVGLCSVETCSIKCFIKAVDSLSDLFKCVSTSGCSEELRLYRLFIQKIFMFFKYKISPQLKSITKKCIVGGLGRDGFAESVTQAQG